MSFFESDDSIAGDGIIRYSLENSSNDDLFEFAFIAAAEQDSPLTLNFTQSSTLGNQQHSALSLGWSSDHPAGTPFVLSSFSTPDSFSSSNVPVDWMHQNLPAIGCQPLRRLAIPGSHDAGMSTLSGGTFLVTEDNTLCQWIDIAGQLNAGFRYFDLRPVIADGNFATGHYSEIFDKWIGGNGQDLASIIGQINDFLDHNNELVILDMSHMYNTDDNWRKLNNDEFGRLLTQLESLKFRYDGPTGPNGDLSSLPLNNFINNGPRVITLNSESSVILPQPAPPGIFPSSALYIYNSFSDTGNAQAMKGDQLSKLAAHRTSRDDPMFLLSWTLSTIDNIRELATQAHSLLFDQSDSGLWKTVYRNRATSYPNILFIDGVGQPSPSPLDNRNVAALCMAINHAVLDGVACPPVPPSPPPPSRRRVL